MQQHGPAELPKVQRVEVEDPPGGRVAGVEHLEAAVDSEAVDPVGPYAATAPSDDSTTTTSRRARVSRSAAVRPASPGADDDHVASGRWGAHEALLERALARLTGRIGRISRIDSSPTTLVAIEFLEGAAGQVCPRRRQAPATTMRAGTHQRPPPAGAASQHLDLLALRVPELNSQLHNVFRFTIQG